ncbi:MAG: hypothetical protein Q9177_005913 [Variospora cf. flavescens]
MESISSLLPYHPFKAIYVLAASLYTLLRLPLWLLFFLPRSLRQHPSYTFRQAVTIRLAKAGVYYLCRIRSHPAWTLAPGSEAHRFTPISPSTKPIYLGVLDDPEIKPARIGGTWYPTPYNHPAEEKEEEKEKKQKQQATIILHIHGGAFVLAEGRDKDFSYGAHLLTTHAGPPPTEKKNSTFVFAVQYRTASNPACRFPAALQDVVTAYQHLLVDLHIPASSIVISGDSAGGNLAIAFLRYITEEQPGVLPKPAAALLWCAWVAPGDAMQPRPCSGNPRYGTDYMTDVFTEWGVRAYAPSPAVDPYGPYISPRDHPFACPGVPMWVQFGSLEVLAGEIVEFAEGMRRIEGNEVELAETEGAPHDILQMGGPLGFGDVAEKMAREMGAWLRGKLLLV